MLHPTQRLSSSLLGGFLFANLRSKYDCSYGRCHIYGHGYGIWVLERSVIAQDYTGLLLLLSEYWNCGNGGTTPTFYAPICVYMHRCIHTYLDMDAILSPSCYDDMRSWQSQLFRVSDQNRKAAMPWVVLTCSSVVHHCTE